MIYLFYGNDEIRSRNKTNVVIDLLLAKSPEASLFRLTKENFNEDNLPELTQGQGLFHNKFIVACDNLLSGSEEEKIDWLELMAKSENIFIFLENNLSVKLLAKLEKLAVKTQNFEKRIGELNKHGTFNIFSITDAFVAKNRSRAWVLYQEALLSGISPEEVLWKLIWSVDNLLLVKNTKDLAKLKMKPYPLTKAKNATKTFSNEELAKLSASFVDLYHLNYLGTDEFEFGLEKIILSI